MKLGDKVKFLRSEKGNWLQPFEDEFGLIVEVDDTHRQTHVRVLTSRGIYRMWEKHVEVIDE
jgi:hypothetical protein